MNKKQLPLLLLALGLMGLFACTKTKKTTTTTPPVTTGTSKSFYCKLDDATFAPAKGGRYYAVTGGTGIQIVGDNADTTVELHITAADVGTYQLGGSTSAANYASVYYTTGNKEFISNGGTVNITKSDGSKISGTFSGWTIGTSSNVHITAGEFNDIPKQ